MAEHWLRGPVPEIPDLLQPVAHALLQARDEVQDVLNDFDPAHLWERPANVASVAFHLRHLKGVLDRLFTYALGRALSLQQLEYLKTEANPDERATIEELVEAFNLQVDSAINTLKIINSADLAAPRMVGRKQLPSTVIGLLFHAAEHTMRHTGQLIATARILQGQNGNVPK